uniref:Uncharacterized protein n=1 Tax=Aegilops tauschii subsp. strangulata TaxID=200361 RepID=A0A453N329_AEGTS
GGHGGEAGGGQLLEDGRGGHGVEAGGGQPLEDGRGGHGVEAGGGQPLEDGRGGHGGEAEGSHGGEAGCAAVSALRGKGAAPEQGQVSPRDAATSACLDGMDRNSTYVLKINLLGNPKKARKDIKCFCFDKVIDSDLTNYKDLVESIVEQYSPRYLEVAHVQYYDDVLKIYPEVTSDQELVSMFEKHSKTKVVHMFVAYCDPSEPYEPITEWHSDAHGQPNNTEQDGDDYLRNPVPENEHVGVDEENIYLEDEPVPFIMVPCSNKEKDKDYVPDHESEAESEVESEDESEDESMSEVEVEEDEEYHKADHAPHIEYNKLDPPMNEGRKYPNMAEFKLALSQHAIKHEFDF